MLPRDIVLLIAILLAGLAFQAGQVVADRWVLECADSSEGSKLSAQTCQIYLPSICKACQFDRLTYDPANDFQPALSPDNQIECEETGTKPLQTRNICRCRRNHSVVE